MKNTVKCRRLLTISLIGLITLFLGCDIGLGTTIDTAVPAVSILTPEVDSVKVGVVEITGLATDETAIKNVQVSLVFNGENKHHYFAEINKETNEWKVVIPTLDDETGEILVEDAKYEIQATAVDTDGKRSTATRSMQVDNTPPTVLITSPNIYGKTKTTLSKRIDIQGEIYDVSDVKSIKVYVFDTDGNIVVLDKEKGNVEYVEADSGTKWYADLEISKDDALTDLRNNEEYYFLPIVEDAAGNKNEYFYHRSDIASKLDTGKLFPVMPQIGKLDQILDFPDLDCGLTKNELSDARFYYKTNEMGEITPDFKYTTEEGFTNNNKYPNFVYVNKDSAKVLWTNIGDGLSAIGYKAPVTGTILPPTDRSALLPDTVEIKVVNLDVFNTLAKDESIAIDVFRKEEHIAREPVDIKAGKIWINPVDQDVDLTRAGESLNFDIKLKHPNDPTASLPTGKYVIYIYCKTDSGTEVEDFKEFEISSGVPTVTETELYKTTDDYKETQIEKSPLSLTAYINKESTITHMKGKALDGDGKSPTTLYYYLKGEERIIDPHGEGDGSYEILLPTENGEYSYELKVARGSGDEKIESSIARTVIVDKISPEVKIQEASVSSTGDEISISGTASDTTGFKAVKYRLLKGNETIIDWTSPEGTNNWAAKISPKDFEQTTYRLEVYAIDSAGNPSETVYKDIVYDYKAPILNKVIDEEPESTYLKLDDTFSFANNNEIVSDNYALDRYEIVATKNDVLQTGAGAETGYWYKKVFDAGVKKATKDEMEIPEFTATEAMNGNWKFTITVYDKAGNKAETVRSFTVDATPPTLTAISTVPDKTKNYLPEEGATKYSFI